MAGKIHGAWLWRLTLGEGVSVRSGKGPPRGDGSRPKVPILDPCASVALRAIGTDEGFPYVLHHAVIVWVQLVRTGRWSTDGAWAWSTEPAPCGSAQAGMAGPVDVGSRPPRRWATVGQVAALLHGPPSADRMAELHAPRDAETRAAAETRPPITGRGISR